MKINTRKIIILLILTGFIFTMYNRSNPRILIKEIEQGYKGVVVDKYYLKLPHVKVKTASGKTIDAAGLCTRFEYMVQIGDTIQKLANDNYILLYKNGNVYQMQYLYIDDMYRNDRRFPEEWKAKWTEDNDKR